MTPYYQDDAVTLYLGDCREWFHTTAPKSVDLVVTDPPYGVGIEYGEEVVDNIENAQSLYLRFIDAATQIAPITLTTVGCFVMEKFLYVNRPPKWRICWRKGITSRPSPVGFTDWEPVFVYGDKVHRHAHDLFTVQPQLMGSYGHPCPKPQAFAEWLISRFCDIGGTVVDPFAGSGTTLVAAKRLGCKAIGIELNEAYCEIAAKRLSQGALPLEFSA